MAPTLLERAATLDALTRAVTDAAAGRGSVALMTGEAEIGKTSLIRAFAREARKHARILLSACDDLMAPRTLGPLRDAALGRDGPLAAALADEEPVEDVFTALLEELAADPPTVLVVEDLHWADDATLDVLAYAARRVEGVGAVLVLTFRDDEVDPRHPLQRLLGVLATCPVHRARAAPALTRGGRAVGGGHRGRPGGGPPDHTRQPVLRHRGARLASRRRPRQRDGGRARASGG
jgi:predicted ATPase